MQVEALVETHEQLRQQLLKVGIVELGSLHNKISECLPRIESSEQVNLHVSAVNLAEALFSDYESVVLRPAKVTLFDLFSGDARDVILKASNDLIGTAVSLRREMCRILNRVGAHRVTSAPC